MPRAVHTAWRPARCLVEAGDEDVADAVEQGGQRQQERVGVSGQPAGGEVGDQQQAEDDAEERHDVGRHGGGAAEAGQGVGGHGDHDGRGG